MQTFVRSTDSHRVQGHYVVHLKHTLLKMQLLGRWPGTAASETRLCLHASSQRTVALGTSTHLSTALEEGQHKTKDLPEKYPSVRIWKEPISE